MVVDTAVAGAALISRSIPDRRSGARAQSGTNVQPKDGTANGLVSSDPCIDGFTAAGACFRDDEFGARIRLTRYVAYRHQVQQEDRGTDLG
jgi:hypothetical protein